MGNLVRVLLVLLMVVFSFVTCNNDGDSQWYESNYSEITQGHVNEICEYWAMCGSGFYENGDAAWDDTMGGCKKFVYNMYDKSMDPGGINCRCYQCLRDKHDDWVSSMGEVIPDDVKDCKNTSHYCSKKIFFYPRFERNRFCY